MDSQTGYVDRPSERALFLRCPKSPTFPEAVTRGFVRLTRTVPTVEYRYRYGTGSRTVRRSCKFTSHVLYKRVFTGPRTAIICCTGNTNQMGPFV
jgi:hypothetical protein